MFINYYKPDYVYNYVYIYYIYWHNNLTFLKNHVLNLIMYIYLLFIYISHYIIDINSFNKVLFTLFDIEISFLFLFMFTFPIVYLHYFVNIYCYFLVIFLFFYFSASLPLGGPPPGGGLRGTHPFRPTPPWDPPWWMLPVRPREALSPE